MIKDKSANDRLPQIVAQTHLAVRQNLRQHMARPCAVIRPCKQAYIEKRHRKIFHMSSITVNEADTHSAWNICGTV